MTDLGYFVPLAVVLVVALYVFRRGRNGSQQAPANLLGGGDSSGAPGDDDH